MPSNRSFSPVVSSDAHSAKEIPAPLQCPMCKKLLNDAVVIPCCGTSYCDECKHLFVNWSFINTTCQSDFTSILNFLLLFEVFFIQFFNIRSLQMLSS